ncbi:MAG TPA: hypothetical protein PKX78_03825 [Candidatus Woesebacteria bacterium]|nr:hypothetical protein [Candidatus Woesebacteria bacterium]
MTHETFRSQWEQGSNTLRQFKEGIEATRDHFQIPFTHAYRSIVKTELGTGSILALGIGTGQVESMAGIEPARIVGIDATRQLLRQAEIRLPGAQLHSGTFAEVLPTLDQRYPVAFASEALDCIDPTELVDQLGLIRQRADKLVAVQAFLPDAEFYAFYNPIPGIGSHGGPGIEGWSEQQQQSVAQRLVQLGISHDLGHPMEMIDDVQTMVERDLGVVLRERYAQLLREMNIRIKPKGVAEM